MLKKRGGYGDTSLALQWLRLSASTARVTGLLIPDHLTCLLRSLHAGQVATVRTGHGTTDWFQIGKGVRSMSRLYIVTLLI